MPRTLTRGQALGVVALVAVLVLNGGLALYNIRQVAATADLVARSHEVLGDVDEALSTVKDAETGQRGYLLTAEARFLGPYRDAVSRIEAKLRRLATTLADDPGQVGRLAELERVVRVRVGLLRQGIELLRAEPDRDRGFEAARQFMQGDAGRRAMDQIRTLVRDMRQAELVRLAGRERAARRSLAVAVGSTVLALGVGLLLVYLVYRVHARHLAERERAAEVLAAERQRFLTTLTSIGDGVIVTDTEGRITLLNPVARSLTRWGNEALGRPIEEVFRIVNEDTRQAVENPVSKVLRLGAIVGLANHTMLIAKDGSESPIDDSGAPIRDPEGRTTGVVMVFRDIAERRRTEELIQEADRRKDEFLAMLAHELRNPLAPIRSAAHALELIGGSDDRLRWVAGVIERQTHQMTRLIEDLLDVSRITSGKITLKRAPVSVAAVLAQAIETARPVADARKQTLDVDVPDEVGLVDADPARLAQAVGNLLDNAMKYSEEGGRIRLTARAEGGDVEIAVRDDGAGIAADLLPHVFDLFTQADRSLERRQGGLGIGLTLTRRLIEMHGGSVRAASDGPGRGSEFVVRLPALEARAAASGDAAAERGDGRPHRARRVLVVDDQADSAETLAMFLGLRGHEVRTAADGPAALAEAAARRPDVVVLDLGLPGVNGYEVARRLRAMPELRDVRIIALTGYATEADRQRTRDAGFDAHLAKPVHPEALEALLDGAPGSGTGA